MSQVVACCDYFCNLSRRFIITNAQTTKCQQQDVSDFIDVGLQPARDKQHQFAHPEDDSQFSAHDFFYQSQFEYGEKLAHLSAQIEARKGGASAQGRNILSHKTVIQQSLERYFLLIGQALNGIELNAEEMSAILNTNCQPVWQWDLNTSLAMRVADNYDVSELSQVDVNSMVVQLVNKLKKVSLVQDAALVDFCERFWREGRKGDFTFEELCSELGFELTD